MRTHPHIMLLAAALLVGCSWFEPPAPHPGDALGERGVLSYAQLAPERAEALAVGIVVPWQIFAPASCSRPSGTETCSRQVQVLEVEAGPPQVLEVVQAPPGGEVIQLRTLGPGTGWVEVRARELEGPAELEDRFEVVVSEPATLEAQAGCVAGQDVALMVGMVTDLELQMRDEAGRKIAGFFERTWGCTIEVDSEGPRARLTRCDGAQVRVVPLDPPVQGWAWLTQQTTRLSTPRIPVVTGAEVEGPWLWVGRQDEPVALDRPTLERVALSAGRLELRPHWRARGLPICAQASRFVIRTERPSICRLAYRPRSPNGEDEGLEEVIDAVETPPVGRATLTLHGAGRCELVVEAQEEGAAARPPARVVLEVVSSDG